MTNDSRFIGKIALISGASRGIGRAVALRMAGEGADVIINYVRNQPQAEEVAQAIHNLGRRAITIRANVGKTEGLEKLFDAIEQEFDGLDFFISNAASGFNRPAIAQRPEGWEHTMDVNAKALLFGAQKALPLMKKRGGGKIVAISSQGSVRVMPEYIAVGASKAALEALVRYLAVELADYNIAVNAVSPGLVETDALKHFSALSDPQLITHAIEKTPAGRLALPEDIAAIVAFLCFEEAYMIRGQVIVADGGYALPVR